MRASTAIPSLALAGLLSLPAFGQNVSFQILPLSGTVVNPGNNPVVVVQPGTILPYEVVVSVENDPTSPFGGLAGFGFDLATTLGLPQTGAFGFAAPVSPLFTVGQNLGTPFQDDLLGIAAAQNLSGVVNPNFALNTFQTLGTGQLFVPDFEGDFIVTLNGSADLITTGTTFGTVRATVLPPPRLTIQTRFAQSGDDPDTGDDQDDDSVTPPVVLPGGSAGPTGGNGQGDDEQVAGEPPEGPPLSNPITPGICGFGAVSGLAFALLGLALIKLRT